MEKDRVITSGATQVILSVTDYQNSELKGSLFSEFYKREQIVHTTIEFIRMMEALFDSIACPQRTMEERSFGIMKMNKKKKQRKKERIQKLPENIQFSATFGIQVSYRKNAEWQGYIWCLENQQVCKFQGVLSMFAFIDKILLE